MNKCKIIFVVAWLMQLCMSAPSCAGNEPRPRGPRSNFLECLNSDARKGLYPRNGLFKKSTFCVRYKNMEKDQILLYKFCNLPLTISMVENETYVIEVKPNGRFGINIFEKGKQCADKFIKYMDWHYVKIEKYVKPDNLSRDIE